MAKNVLNGFLGSQNRFHWYPSLICHRSIDCDSLGSIDNMTWKIRQKKFVSFLFNLFQKNLPILKIIIGGFPKFLKNFTSCVSSPFSVQWRKFFVRNANLKLMMQGQQFQIIEYNISSLPPEADSSGALRNCNFFTY